MNPTLEALTKLRDQFLYFVELAGLNDTDRGLLRDKLCALDLNCFMPVVDEQEIDKHLNAILKASGSSLRNYTMQKTLDEMRAAMRAALSSAPKEKE